MISSLNSATITAIDFIVLATAITLSVTVFRQKPVPSLSGPGRAAGLVIFGLALLGTFYSVDLAFLHIVPLFSTREYGLELSSVLHTQAQWLVLAVALSLICIGFILDGGARRRAEARLEANEARYRSIVQDQIDMVCRWKPGGDFTYVNESYARAFGISVSDAPGTNLMTLLSEASREKILQCQRTVTAEQPVHRNIHEIRLPDGGTAWQEWISRGLFDSTGNLIEMQSTGRDVTELMRTARALQRSEERFRGLVENTDEWVWEANMDFRCVYSNGRVREALGYTPEEIARMSLAKVMHPDSVKEFSAQFPALHAAGKGWSRWQLRFIHRNGSIRYLESSAEPVFDDKGEITGYRGIDRDRTFEALLTDLSTELFGCRADEVQLRINRSLEKIGNSYAVDRISIWSIKKPFIRFVQGWARDGASAPPTEILQLDDFPFANEEVRLHGKTLKVESAHRLPADAKEGRFMMQLGIKSMLVMPLLDAGLVVGIAVCTTVQRERSWNDDVATDLRLLLEKITDARRQADSTLELQRRGKDLERSETLARVGSYAFYPAPNSGDFPNGWEATFSAVQAELLEAAPGQESIMLFFERIHSEDRQRIVAAMDAMVNSGTPFQEQFQIENPDGDIIHVASRADLEIGATGNIARIVGSCRDITDQIHRERELIDAVAEVEALRDRLEEENVQLREEISSYTGFSQIIGDSKALRTSLNMAARAAPTDATVLILGETGTGKELVAKAIHSLSARADHRLVSVNCTALLASLVESELFGHEKGAFTDASTRRAGRFELADGGTLFLDEIGDLSLELQAKLLRVLEDGSFERVGGTATLRPDVRLVAATNRDLEAAVRAGEFRADLYYRINTVPIRLPPLRERKEDIPMLAQYFVVKHSERLGKSVNAISSRMIEYLLNRDWPGNVRELEHYIERSLISATGRVLSIGERFENGHTLPGEKSLSSNLALRSVEREHILQILDETEWVIEGVRGAAAMLGLAPSTLRSKMKRLRISRTA